MNGWNFSEIFSVVAAEIPDRVALVQGDRRLTWAELDPRATALAATMLRHGLHRQDKVAQYLFNAVEYLESVIACFKAALVPLNTNYRYGADELTYLWTNGDVACVVFHGAFADTIAPMRHRVPGVRLWLWVDDGSGPCPDWAVPYETAATMRPEPGWQRWGTSGDDLLLLYTGGTTGMPKGVMWRQEDLFLRLNTENGTPFPEAADAEFLRTKVSHHGRAHLSAAPLMHGAGLLTCFMTLSRGGAISHLRERSFSAADLLDTVQRDRPATLMWVGDAFARPVLRALEENPGRWDLSSLRTIISSGVVFSAEVKEALLRHLPDVAIADVFGSSETMSLGRSVTTRGQRHRTAAFKARGNTRVVTEGGVDVVPGSGQPGLLAIGGRQPVGYYNDPEKTAATFRLIGGVRHVVPGDWATVDADGTISLIGRGSECINTGGEKVFPEEVEIVLRDHPGVGDVVVTGVPDDRFGQSVLAVVAARPGSGVTGAELIGHVRVRLAAYKAPRAVMFVDQIDRLPNGKADLKAIRDRVARRADAG